MTDKREMSPAERHYVSALGRILADSELRVFLWRIIEDDCRVFQEDYPINAQAYSLLAKQEIGKRLLNAAKAINPEAVFSAEQEYMALADENHRFNDSHFNENMEE